MCRVVCEPYIKFDRRVLTTILEMGIATVLVASGKPVYTPIRKICFKAIKKIGQISYKYILIYFTIPVANKIYDARVFSLSNCVAHLYYNKWLSHDTHSNNITCHNIQLAFHKKAFHHGICIDVYLIAFVCII